MRLSIILFLFSFIANAQTYKVIYKMDYASNLLNLKNIRKEKTILMIESTKKSTFTSENVYKQDSIGKLVSEGKLSPYDVMNEKYPKTLFKHFITKNYESQDLKAANVLTVSNYVYTQKNELNWQLHPDTLKIKNYVCNKATVSYEGRDYTAWYTTEIPISDGPYKFWGLPGLILKIYDSENHYTFTLESFEKYDEKVYDIPFQRLKTYEVSYEKFKQISKDTAEDPIKALETEQGVKTISIDGKDPASVPIKNKRNYIGRF